MEDAVAQPHHDPALHGALGLGLVARLGHARRQHAHAIVQGKLLIGWIQIGLVTAGTRHAGFRVVLHQQLRAAAVELEGVDLRLQETFHLFVGQRFGIGVTGDAQRADEQRGFPHRAIRLTDRNHRAGPVQKQALPGPVLLTHHHVLRLLPMPVELAEAAITVAARMLFAVLLP